MCDNSTKKCEERNMYSWDEWYLQAKKYSYRFCGLLYFYVIYDNDNRVRLTIPAFE